MTIQKMITVTIKKNKTNENSDITPNNDNILQEKLRQIIGLLNHLAIHTRPEILFSVTYLATRITTAKENDIDIYIFSAGKRELIYYTLLEEFKNEIEIKEVGRKKKEGQRHEF